MQESYVRLYGIVFMLGAGYTLLHNGHVRVDIFYRLASERHKAWVFAPSVGSPLCGLYFSRLRSCRLRALHWSVMKAGPTIWWAGC